MILPNPDAQDVRPLAKRRKPARLKIVLYREGLVGSSPGVCATPPRTSCGSRRFFKSHLLLILSRFLRKTQPAQQKREKRAENAGRTLPFAKAEECFPEFTPGCVARQFLLAADPDAKGDHP